MFATRKSSRANYEYLVEVDRTQLVCQDQRYMASVTQIVDRSAGDRVANQPQFRRHYAETPERAIERACAEADHLFNRFPDPPDIAQMVFDSQLASTPAGMRTARPGSRRLLYTGGGHVIDVQVQPGNAAGRTAMIGQITSPEHPDSRIDGTRVLLERDMKTIARTTTNRFGEFDIEFDGPPFDLCLTFSLDRGGVVVKLGNLTRMPV